MHYIYNNDFIKFIISKSRRLRSNAHFSCSTSFFGSKNIPNLARGLGKGMREFREATDGIKREIEKSAEPVTEEMKKASQDVQQQINDHRAANQ